jgi:hypothetical protein
MRLFTRFVLLFSLIALPISFHVAIKNSLEPHDNGRFWFAALTFIGCGLLAIQSLIAMLHEPKRER